ncbi:Fur family transcriptional regulator [Sporomusa acidovorans]|uniref:Zinc-specific metallo-regulatory protein n=1 Tax=Sporomusa acidovorans (strain ATCC 49682 / DSM 3132 / Mol) TaxID=1123286 RepID=A0ABZ3J294_SPOA4|nr:Fur family transcriptional regulator [Sporomusa acidovorans]OZC24090.1 zinc-specific metallo-regulatory protein [Sporomusa acidovorans DSM 3132]SDF68540.1 Fur family transcriptional regulator, zinc uptake regulator [Sporomusa acidovorans]
MDRLIDVLRNKGYKITPQRRAVITALSECGQFPTAQQILEHVKQTNPDVSLDTIYRNLSLFVELGIVHEIQTCNQDGNRFEMVTTGHHHHVICLDCGKVQCLHFCPISSAEIEKVEENGFAIVSHSLEFYGYCQECRAAGQ